MGMVPLFGPVDHDDIEAGIKNTDAVLNTLEDAGQETLLFFQCRFDVAQPLLRLLGP
jgi:hypothetical protein